MAFDEARGVAVLFGGVGQTVLNETWEWNGGAWLQRFPNGAPPPRHSFAMAYDVGSRRTAVFGGIGSQHLGDLWEWDGSAWGQRLPTPGPTSRYGAAMAYDPTRGGLLMFGGITPTAIALDETWHWDGAAWTRFLPANPPYARGSHAMVTDTTRRRVSMFGGDVTDPLVWEWDGAEWSARFLLAPTPRHSHAMAHDPVRGLTIVFGGERSSSATVLLGDTWKFATDVLAVATVFGAGCPGTNGVPAIGVAPYRLPWLADTLATEVRSVPPLAPVIVATGTELSPPQDLGPLGMPGCSQFSGAQDAALVLATSNGLATHDLVVPDQPALVGIELVQQAAVLDPPANGAGITTSSAMRLRVGVR
ncbi:MAG: hypothetical protein IPK26_17320 [Planctomycetes bacterium]|nr:hypothetical protein [Planctomycetota bacterium]